MKKEAKNTTKSEVYAKYKGAKISPKKVAIILDLIRGKNLKDAKIALAFDSSKAAKISLKTLKSAEANATNNNHLNSDALYVSEAWVSGGRMVRTGMFGGKGRFKPLLKRSSHLYIGLSERK